jgi:hypothetical protein
MQSLLQDVQSFMYIMRIVIYCGTVSYVIMNLYCTYILLYVFCMGTTLRKFQ